MIPLHGLKVVAGCHFLSAISTCQRLTTTMHHLLPVLLSFKHCAHVEVNPHMEDPTKSCTMKPAHEPTATTRCVAGQHAGPADSSISTSGRDNCDVTRERYVRAIHMPLHACVAIFLHSSRQGFCRCALEGFEVGFRTCFPSAFLVKTRCQMPMANPSKDSGHPCLAGRWFWCVCYTFFSTAVNILAEGDKLSRLHATSADVFQTRMQAFIFRTFTPNASKCQNFAVLQKHQYKARALWYESVARFPPKKQHNPKVLRCFFTSLAIPRLNVTKLLHGFAKGEGTATQKSVLATIHQPSEEVFNLFDKAWGYRFPKDFETTLKQNNFSFPKRLKNFQKWFVEFLPRISHHFGGPDSGGRSHSLLWFTFRGFASLHFVGIALSSWWKSSRLLHALCSHGCRGGCW